jgi:uncharacterized protein
MRVVLTGSTGLIGSALARRLEVAGHTVARLVRRIPRPGTAEIYWNPGTGRLTPASLEGFDAVVHLAAESLDGLWTAKRKQSIYESRVAGTRLLAGALAAVRHRPSALVCASAIGFYGNRGSERLTEQSPPGSGFLAHVCLDWEAASTAARESGIRVAAVRLGIVLSREGGALPKMLAPFRMGVGGKFGNGGQYWSWITLEDAVEAFVRALEDDSISGPVNAVAPEPVTNLEFTRILGAALSRPTFFSVPAFAARLVLGEMGQELLLSGARVVPSRLQASGFTFRHPTLPEALKALGVGPR